MAWQYKLHDDVDHVCRYRLDRVLAALRAQHMQHMYRYPYSSPASLCFTLLPSTHCHRTSHHYSILFPIRYCNGTCSTVLKALSIRNLLVRLAHWECRSSRKSRTSSRRAGSCCGRRVPRTPRRRCSTHSSVSTSSDRMPFSVLHRPLSLMSFSRNKLRLCIYPYSTTVRVRVFSCAFVCYCQCRVFLCARRGARSERLLRVPAAAG